ncbi:50S ribosomal protein L23 [Candidatus Williamhamiltonella defendens]|uniref:50S ribosomal protein L23 n=1 Tax=Candidatus Williamhamiltonella defendens TaxID=138072 RepID=UPI00130ED178|nr:50S ribosomal protein L23 [Candidatus Hamiltonella defensa]
MSSEEYLLKILRATHISEKSTFLTEKKNTFVFKVLINSTKAQIKAAVKCLLKVDVIAVNTLIVKGKTKRRGQRIGRCIDWKKAYVTLKKDQNLDLVTGQE